MSNKSLKEQREVLRRYLKRYLQSKKAAENLERRLNNLRDDLKNPSISSLLTGMPRGNGRSEGAAAPVYRVCEAEERLNDELEKSRYIMTQIMNILDYLSSESNERAVLEYKYIDGYSEKEITGKMCYSRSAIQKILKKGLDELLAQPKVQSIITRYDKGLEDINYERTRQ